MKYVLAAIITMMCAGGTATADAVTGDGETDVWLQDVPVHGVITADDADSYHVEVGTGEHYEIIATVDGGDLLVCLVDEESRREMGALATVERPAILTVSPGRYRVSVRTTTSTAYEMVRIPVRSVDRMPAPAPPATADRARTPRWPEREVPELARSATGVLGPGWGSQSRSYDLDVAPGYRAQLTVECDAGAFEAMAVAASGRVLSLLLPHYSHNTVELRPGKYLVYLVAHADKSEYSLAVRMIRAPTPGAK